MLWREFPDFMITLGKVALVSMMDSSAMSRKENAKRKLIKRWCPLPPGIEPGSRAKSLKGDKLTY